jgi:hypothetical protein
MDMSFKFGFRTGLAVVLAAALGASQLLPAEAVRAAREVQTAATKAVRAAAVVAASGTETEKNVRWTERWRDPDTGTYFTKRLP